MVIGESLSPFRPMRGVPDRTVVELHERPQSRAGALGDLAVLLGRPAKAPAELRAAHLQRELAREHQTLIGAELPGEALDAPEPLAQHDERLGLGAPIDDRDLTWSDCGE